MHKNQLVCVCVCVCVCTCAYVCMHTWVQAWMCACMHVYMHACVWACIYMSVHMYTCASSCKLFPPPFKNFFLLPSFDGSSTFAKVPCFVHLTLFTTGLPVSKTDRLLPWYAIFPSHSPGCLEQDAFPSFSEVRLPPPHFPPIFFRISTCIQNLDSFLFSLSFTSYYLQVI